MNFHAPISALALLLLCQAALACATFDIETPQEMVAMEHSDDEYVAMTYDGVVLRVNVYSQGESSRNTPRGSQQFWVQSTRERMRTTGGYALFHEEQITSANDYEGTRLEFGRDQDGVPYKYWVILFVTEDHIHVIDVGGRQDRFDNAGEAIHRALASYEVIK